MAGAAARFEVLLTEGAERDLKAIHAYIAEFDCAANANYALDPLMEVVESLSSFPERGSYPKELVALGIKEYRQTAFKPCAVLHLVARGFCVRQALRADQKPFPSGPYRSHSARSGVRSSASRREWRSRIRHTGRSYRLPWP